MIRWHVREKQAMRQGPPEKGRRSAVSGCCPLDDRFNHAIQQLGDRGSIDIRQGGIHAFERLLRDSPRHHAAIIQQLSSFVREHSPVAGCGSKPVPNGIREAVGVIGRNNIPLGTRVDDRPEPFCLTEGQYPGITRG